VEVLAYRLPTRMEALAACHMLRARGHAAALAAPPFADDGTTLMVRAGREAAAYVRVLVEQMFPGAVRCPDFPKGDRVDGVR
jgi:hypothetical protein